MKHYEIRSGISPQRIRIELEERHRFNMQPGATLWQVERESETEAAVRRMGWIERQTQKGDTLVFAPPHSTISGLTVSQFIDRDCPPPALKETQLDWNTGEPIKEVPVWLMHDKSKWLAGVSEHDWCRDYAEKGERAIFWFLITCKAAIGSTRENALRNLAELNTSKSQTK